MIITLLLKVIYWLIYAIFGVFLFLPDVSLPIEFTSNVASALSYAQAINSFIPFSELFYVIGGVFLIYEGYYLLLKIVNWIIRKIPSIQ